MLEKFFLFLLTLDYSSKTTYAIFFNAFLTDKIQISHILFQ